MNRTVIVVVAAVAFLAGVFLGPRSAVAANSTASSPGRFVLLSAKYETTLIKGDHTGTSESLGLFKLDTQTGQTWRMLDGFADGEIVTDWVQIGEKR